MNEVQSPVIPRVAVVGTGYWGRNLVRNYHELGALEVICDKDEVVSERFKKLYQGVTFCRTLEDAVTAPGISAVVIATPAETHFSLARESLLAGKHVFAEKPLVLREEEGRELMRLAGERNLVLMVGHLLRYHPAFECLKGLASSGELGRINYIYSHRLNLGKIRREENILWSFAPHDISMILALAGERPDAVSATGGYYLHQKVADVTTTHIEFPSGLRAHIFVSWLHPFKVQQLVVVGDRKMAVFDDTLPWADKLLLYPHEIRWQNGMPIPARAEPERLEFPQAEPLRLECEHFLDCVRNGGVPMTDGAEGLRVLEILNAGQKSLDTNGGRVNLENNEEDALREDASVPEIVSLLPVKPDYFVHPTGVIDDNVSIGTGTKIWHFSHILSGSRIGERCNIGQNVVIGPDVKVGSGCKIQNNISVYKGVTLEDDVFCGPSMVFTNVFNPRAAIRRMDEIRPTLVKKGASLGANCTIVCGNTVGRFAFIGAGAVLTRSVPDHALMAGNPARRVGWMCECGEKLDGGLHCSACGATYREVLGAGLAKEEVAQSSKTDLEKISFIDLHAQQQKIQPSITQRIHQVLQHGQYIMGPEIRELEQQLAGFVGTKHAITCASGTDALLMALMAYGVGPGDAVFTTPFTFIATGEVISLLGATPIFVDIDPRTFNIDPAKLDAAITALKSGDRTLHPLPYSNGREGSALIPRGIIPVDLFGLPCEYDRIEAIAGNHGLFVIEDAAQSFGAEYHGRRACSMGDVGCTSFFPAKPLGCYGDGGAVFTNDDGLAEKMESVRVHGKGADKYDNVRIGLNARMDTLQAAILLSKFEVFPQELEARQRVAKAYTENLYSLPSITPPYVPAGVKSAWAQYSILSQDAKEMQKALSSRYIPTAVYYPKPLHLQTAYEKLEYRDGDFPVSERVSRGIFSVPMHPYLSGEQIERIGNAIADAIAKRTS